MQPVPPKVTLKRFSCPTCHAFADQAWFKVGAVTNNSGGPFHSEEEVLYEAGRITLGATGQSTFMHMPALTGSRCASCTAVSIWNNSTLIYPKESPAPPHSADLPETCTRDYDEAARILQDSPRGAAALLRLVIQKLCEHLGGQGKNIDEDIGYLVAKKGLPEMVRKALDAVRVIGNKSVHPGAMNMEDDVETATALFRAVNVIVHATITQPREIEDLYEKLPESTKKAADKRDGRNS